MVVIIIGAPPFFLKEVCGFLLFPSPQACSSKSYMSYIAEIKQPLLKLMYMLVIFHPQTGVTSLCTNSTVSRFYFILNATNFIYGWWCWLSWCKFLEFIINTVWQYARFYFYLSCQETPV